MVMTMKSESELMVITAMHGLKPASNSMRYESQKLAKQKGSTKKHSEMKIWKSRKALLNCILVMEISAIFICNV